jgi:hypothetical protein
MGRRVTARAAHPQTFVGGGCTTSAIRLQNRDTIAKCVQAVAVQKSSTARR